MVPEGASPQQGHLHGQTPAGQTRGVLWRWPSVDKPPLRYEPGLQRWVEGPEGAFWVGWWRDDPPAPTDLIRAEVIGGYLVELADGNEWIVPAARKFPAGTELPQALMLGPSGEVVTEPLPRYAAINADAERVWAVVQHEHGTLELDEGEEPPELTVQEAWDTACRALALNYRVGPAEVSALRLLTTRNQMAILNCLVDFPAFMEMVAESAKKNAGSEEGDSEPTCGGDEAN